MSYLYRSIIFNLVFISCFILIYIEFNSTLFISMFYLFGLAVIACGWMIPHLRKSSSFIHINLKPSFVWIAFFLYSLVILKLRGYEWNNLLGFFDDRGEFVSSQEGKGIFFILFFEVFFGYWLACFFKKSISTSIFLLIIVIFTLLAFSRSYFFYLLIAILVTSKITFKNILVISLIIGLSTIMLLIRFGTVSLFDLAKNPLFVELFTKYPFVGIARLSIAEDMNMSFYNYFSSLIMPYDIISYGFVENLLNLDKGVLSYSRQVGGELGLFKDIPMLSKGTLGSFNAFGTVLFPFKFYGIFSFVMVLIVSFFNSLLFKLSDIKRNESMMILAFILCSGTLISIFSTLILMGILIGYLFPLTKKNEEII